MINFTCEDHNKKTSELTETVNRSTRFHNLRIYPSLFLRFTSVKRRICNGENALSVVIFDVDYDSDVNKVHKR